ncbi:HutD family protein [Streptomyces diastatochromogenes]|nr:HutD family protein [Streptomyces diastatochromogenes]
MAPQILRASDRTPAPWKNGGGITTEVVAHPRGAGTEDFAWRISVADVASSGPFSTFEGVDRIITVVEGPGMALTVDGTEHLVDTRYAPLAFSGEATTDCRLLDGPIVDFNVMVRRTGTKAEVSVERGSTVLRPAPPPASSRSSSTAPPPWAGVGPPRPARRGPAPRRRGPRRRHGRRGPRGRHLTDVR